ncbi:hypothetical protein [Methanosarcina horonobensis]|nr:hypothetical protein [Methanosarcina horonobensis]
MLGLTMDMRGYRSRRSAEKQRLSWNRTDVAAVGFVALMGIGVLITGII